MIYEARALVSSPFLFLRFFSSSFSFRESFWFCFLRCSLVPFTLGLLSNQRYKKKGGLTALNRCLVENRVSIGFDDSSIRESHFFFFFTSWSIYEMVGNYLKSKKLEKYIDILDTCWYFLQIILYICIFPTSWQYIFVYYLRLIK